MRRNIAAGIFAVCVLVLASVFLWPLLSFVLADRVCTDMDINSGDFRVRTYVLSSWCMRERIEQTDFSREVRRLQIVAPTAPTWKRKGLRPLVPGGIKIVRDHPPYMVAAHECARMMMALELAEAPDDVRRTVLHRFMATLSAPTPDPHVGDDLSEQVDEVMAPVIAETELRVKKQAAPVTAGFRDEGSAP